MQPVTKVGVQKILDGQFSISLPVFCADCVARGVEILSLGDTVDFPLKGP